MKQIRQGDLLFVKVEDRNPSGVAVGTTIIQEGESTGHAHAIANPATLLAVDGIVIYVVADEPVLVRHQEHREITLDPGVWQVVRQVERDIWSEEAEAIRRVLD